MIIGIYGLQNKLKPEKWYIGQSWDIYDRWIKAYEKLGCDRQPKIYNALLKYGYDGFEKHVIEMCNPNTDQGSLDLKETIWIKHYNSVENGYNCMDGGKGGRVSKESVVKISNSLRGVPWTEERKNNHKSSMQKRRNRVVSKETRLKLSLANKGKKLGPYPKERVANMVLSKIGFKHTEESKKKMCGHVISEETRKKLSMKSFSAWEKRRSKLVDIKKQLVIL